jgi:TolA-binding protein
MRRVLRGPSVLSGCLLAAAALAAEGPVAMPPGNPAAQTSAPAEGPDRELQALLERVGQLGNLIAKDPQSAQSWRHQLAQGEVMLQIAARSKGKERDDWYRAAVDSHYSAAVDAPDSEPAAQQKMSELAAHIARAFPGGALYSYATMQEMQAEYVRLLARAGDNPSKAQVHLRNRLLHFAWDHPALPDAPRAVLQAAQICETLGKPDDARRCYRYVADRYSGQPAARKALGSLWRLGPVGQPVELRLPHLFAADSRGPQTFDLVELRGRLVYVYFWTSTAPRVAEDFAALKHLTDRCRGRDVEVVYVNLDSDQEKARVFLAGLLTAGVHVAQAGGLDSPIAEVHGLQNLPSGMRVGKVGRLLQLTLEASRVEAAVTDPLAQKR